MWVNIQISTLKTLVYTKLRHGYSLSVTGPSKTTQMSHLTDCGHAGDEMKLSGRKLRKS